MKIMGQSKVSKGMTNSKDEECGIILRTSRISDQQVLKKMDFSFGFMDTRCFLHGINFIQNLDEKLMF